MVVSDNAEEFARFYEKLYKRPLPRHAREDWVEPLYSAPRKYANFFS
jgi:hypothetical protein